MNNSKPILALMGPNSKGCEFQPLKISINFAALFFFGVCLMYVSQSLFSGERTGKGLLCVICCSLVAMVLVYGRRTSTDQSSMSYQNAVFGLQVSDTSLNFTAGKIILEAMTWG